MRMWRREIFSSSIQEGCVRARFAPSPTGSLHLGGARTALLNYLLVRKAKEEGLKASLILRIEDTDTKRSTVENGRDIMNELHWLGVDFDEGPYYSSQRRYNETVEDLVARGAAYRDFGGVEDWRCASRVNEARARAQNGEVCVIRFKAPEIAENRYSVPDAIRGSIDWSDLRAAIPSDFIIARSDGRPLYNVCAAIDDAEMRITHVVRGEEHMANTLRQALILTALGHELPCYAHCGLLVDKVHRKKLSKRDESGRDYSVATARQLGIRPTALASYLATLGGGVNVSEDYLKSVHEHDILKFMARHFELARVSPAATAHDPEKLDFIDAQLFHRLDTASRAHALGVQLEALGSQHLSESTLHFIATNLVDDDIIQCNVLANRVHTGLKFELDALIETVDRQGPDFRNLVQVLANHLLHISPSFSWQHRLNDTVSALSSQASSRRTLFSALRLLITSTRSGFALDKHATLIDLAAANSIGILSTRQRIQLVSEALLPSM